MDEVDLPEHAREPRTGLRRLAPEIEAARDQIVDHFEDKPFSELKTFVQKLLETEEDETKRLGALAARVYMLRKRIIDFEETVELVPAEELAAIRDMSDRPTTGDGWARVRVLENCEVNGMRLPEGIIVDVSAEDAQRLIDSGHAELREAGEPDLSEDDDEFDASESADLPDSEYDAEAEDAPEPEDEVDETDDEVDETDDEIDETDDEADETDDDEADEVAEADATDEEILAAAEIAEDAETDAPDAEDVPDEQVLDTSDHALATAIAETAEAFNEIDVALAADIAEEQAASDDENETGDEADEEVDAEADET
ncbi:MAG: hypothetical protein CBD16_01245 [Betaproteobacteria bacterium TMED156]|nr:MAG: hypothetical protein CBD16_01245 [Betaproteobacteria bacterium TMED156]